MAANPRKVLKQFKNAMSVLLNYRVKQDDGWKDRENKAANQSMLKPSRDHTTFLNIIIIISDLMVEVEHVVLEGSVRVHVFLVGGGGAAGGEGGGAVELGGDGSATYPLWGAVGASMWLVTSRSKQSTRDAHKENFYKYTGRHKIQ